MSSGSFTNHRNGPGYQLYYHESLRRFKFLLETSDSRWSLLLHEEVGLWTHMTFTWNNQDGLRYYEDGNLSTFTNRPEFVSPLRRQNYTPVITLARPSNVLRLGEYGKFEISKFAIWLKVLSAEDIAGVYRNSVVYNQENVLCCYFQSGGCEELIGSLSNHDDDGDKNVTNLHIRAVFKWLSKVITRLRLLLKVIGLKDSRQFFNQWEVKPKPVAPRTRIGLAFVRLVLEYSRYQSLGSYGCAWPEETFQEFSQILSIWTSRRILLGKNSFVI